MTGKAFHIYRPIAEDALGNKAWCDVHIDKYVDPTSLTLTIPQQFLDEAVYPLMIDPDFGYTFIGATLGIAAQYEIKGSPYGVRQGSAWAMLAPGGTANYIRAYIGGSEVCDCRVFINERDSGGAGTHGQIATAEELNCVTALHWEEFTLASEALTEAVNYILNLQANEADLSEDNAYSFKYDIDINGAVDSYLKISTGDYGAPESPWIDDPDVPTTHDYSIYVNYDEAAVAGLENKSANMGSKMVAAGLI